MFEKIWGKAFPAYTGTMFLRCAGATVAATKPDLIGTSPSVSDSSLTPGRSLTVTATVKNQGNATAGSSALRYYRSNDATITTGDSQLTTASIATFAAGATSVVTAPTTDGTYWVGSV